MNTVYSNKMVATTTLKPVMLGGAGAADYVISAVGGMGEQQALPGSNVIATKVGGKKGKKGGNALAELAVPAVLLIANHQYAKRSRANKSMRSRKSRKNNRRSRRYKK